MPAGGDFVEFAVAGFEAGESGRATFCHFHSLDGFGDDGVDLSYVFLDIALREGEEFALGFLHHFLNVVAFIESSRLHLGAEGDKFACKKFLHHDTSVVFHVGSRADVGGQFHYVRTAAGLLKGAVFLQLIDYSNEVDGLLRSTKSLDSLVDERVARVVERFRAQHIAHGGICVLRY